MTAKPVILTVDDEPVVLAAVERDLRSRYASDYRIVGAESGGEAIEALHAFALRDDPVALLLVDQRMPQVTGIDVLRESIEQFPSAKKVLLTAYADTEAAIRAINDVDLDHYIMKPWDPPEEALYPILDDLLDDWTAGYRPTFEGIRVIGQHWSVETHELKAFLAKNQIPYRSIDMADESAEGLMVQVGAQMSDLPVVLFQDGRSLMHPTLPELAEKAGLKTQATAPAYDLVVIGAGPSGLAASVYGASEGLNTLLIEEEAPGGQAGQSSRIENYLGFPKGISGADLARRAVSQATRFGVELLVPASVGRIERKDPFRIVHLTDGSHVTAKAVVATSGVAYRRLPAEGTEELTGAGVYYGTSRTDAMEHQGQKVYLVGGGNSAGQAALFLTGFAESVTILIRGDNLDATMSRYLIDAIEAHDAVSVTPNTHVEEARGDDHLESLVLADTKTAQHSEVEAGALFIFIGQTARSEWISDIVEVDDNGFIVTGTNLGSVKGWNVNRDPLPFETSVPGIFAAGDVRRGSIKRVAAATGDGASVIRSVHEHLAEL